jgi:hypothetical protein
VLSSEADEGLKMGEESAQEVVRTADGLHVPVDEIVEESRNFSGREVSAEGVRGCYVKLSEFSFQAAPSKGARGGSRSLISFQACLNCTGMLEEATNLMGV